MLRILWILFFSLTFCPRLFACGPFERTNSIDEYFTFRVCGNNMKGDNPQIVYLDREEQQIENCRSWAKLTSWKIPIPDIQRVVYLWSYRQLQQLYDKAKIGNADSIKNRFAKWIVQHKDLEIASFLLLAKRKADLCNAQSYNEYLQKVLRIVTTRFDRVGRNSVRQLPTLQINQAEIIRTIDAYVRTKLFSRPFNPFEDFNWKILLHNEGVATQHIVKEITKAIYYLQEQVDVTEAVVEKIYFSSVPTLKIRQSYSLDLEKTIYEKVGYPSNKGEFEKSFMEYLDSESEVSAFIKINESQHSFASIYYIRQDGLLATYHPDFMVRTDTHIYIIETKAQDQIHNKNVRQKQLATVEWCKKINQLPSAYRMDWEWEYVLLGETNFDSLRRNGAIIAEICEIHKVSESAVKGELFN